MILSLQHVVATFVSQRAQEVLRVVMDTLCEVVSVAPTATVEAEMILIPLAIAVFLKMSHGLFL